MDEWNAPLTAEQWQACAWMFEDKGQAELLADDLAEAA